MSEGALSEEAMLAGLRDIQLPAEAAGGLAADVAAAVAIAGALALIVGAVVRLLSRPASAPKTVGVGERLEALRTQPPEVRRVALLRMLKAQSPERYEAMRAHLYRRDAEIDLERLEAEVRSVA